MKKFIAVLAAMAWISVSEFTRNQFIVHDQWLRHYRNMGLTFPESPANGAMWGVWSLVFAWVLLQLKQKFSNFQTILLGWVIGFGMMWLVIGNLGVLPLHILPYAIPLSLLEVAVATWIIRKIDG